jgi:hypothetical protein
MRKLILAALACAAASLTLAPSAFAADFTLHGGAEAVNGSVRLVSDLSDGTTANDSSWIDFSVQSGLTFSEITTLATQFNVTDDDCGGGSPRFQINIGGKNVFVYLGPAGTLTDCAPNTWISSGNLVGTTDACRVDTSQYAGGTQCSTWAAAVALLGSQTVTGIQLVVDSGWFFVPPNTQTDQEQTILVRNVQINGKTFIRPGGQSNQNPSRLCAAERASMGLAAFNEAWGTNGNDRNAFGKCVSAMAKLQANGTANAAHTAILSAAKTCKAQGLRGERLGACVSARDGVSATLADPAGKGGKAKGRKP